MALVLASKSPRRRALFSHITPHFVVAEAGVDEGSLFEVAPALFAQQLASQKATEVFLQRGKDVVVGCDTVVEIAGEVLGKPKDRADAARMIGLLSGKKHRVHTGVSICLPGHEEQRFTETTAVYFAPVPQQEVQAYVRTEEPYDKAGAYGIQGWAARYVTRIEGCFYNVMGLPVATLYHTLHTLGVV
ncbi:MAG: nucleoside triphosphate pyrophosphatase [Oscillospiraceae bacterium]